MQTKQLESETVCLACQAEASAPKSSDGYKRTNLLILSSGLIYALGFLFEYFLLNPLIGTTLFLVVEFVVGFPIMKNGLRSLVRKRLFDINFLMTVATLGSFVIGAGAEGAVAMYLFYIAEYLEVRAGTRAKDAVAALVRLAPDTAHVFRDGQLTTVHTHTLELTDVVAVKPGDKIPIDGVITKGIADVNQAAITGESIPVTKRIGDEVYAGTINEDGYLEIEVTKPVNETTLSKITRLVEDAQKQKSDSEVFIQRFAKYYTPLVIITAFSFMLIPPFLLGQPLFDWVYRGFVLLVTSCPCAMVLSTPVAMISGLTAASRNGVLIKSGRQVEELKDIRAVVFDKTGTLTEGKPEVVDILSLSDLSEHDILQIAASVEEQSRHPIASAITQKAAELNIPIKSVSKFISYSGMGIKGQIDSEEYMVGRPEFFKNRQKIPSAVDLVSLAGEGKTVILVGNTQNLIGIITVRDKVRENAASTIQQIESKGIKTVMLTGDNNENAKVVAKDIGISEYYADLLPQDKVRIIEELNATYTNVAMVGDGVNDAPALARAGLGIAMGAIGSDVAIETADIALMHDDLEKISYLVGLSHKTMGVVKQNITLSLTLKLVIAILTFFGLVSLWMAAGIGDMGLTLAVILNALRLGYTYQK